MLAETPTFERPSLTDVAYKAIRDQILHGTLAPDHKLVVADLVEQWKISNTPIKEALNRLVADELAVALPRRGMRVRKYGSAETREIFELRTLYEAHCARLMAESVQQRPGVLERLAKTLADSQAILDGAEVTFELPEFDADFHIAIVEQCGNETLIKNFHRLHAHTFAMGSATKENCSIERWEETHREHEKIYRALAKGEPDRAEAAMRLHLEKTCASVLGLLKARSRRLKARTV
jgi:DNA-binding GntR family transcriptional regulator